MSGWQFHRILLPRDCRRIVRVGFDRDGNNPAKPIGGVYLRIPGRLFSVLRVSRFRVVHG